MKRYIVGLVLGLAAHVAVADAVVSDAAQGAVVAVGEAAPLPAGVITEQHPLKKAYVEKAGTGALLFRPSENMPEIVHEDMLRGAAENGKTPEMVSQFIGYLPKLTVLPCAKGCEGADYEAAVKSFLKGYQGNGKHFKERGEMKVQVRWFHHRPWYLRHVPYGEDIFGVSFIMEGKLVSLGRSSGIGIGVTTKNLASPLGARLAAELAFTAGLGLKPTFLREMEEGTVRKVAVAMGEFDSAVTSALGSENVRSRIEPVPAGDEYKALLPAVDGILPGEIAPISAVRYYFGL
ncbi:hypothetical protein ACFSQE_12015 [Vogesella fluminis]|uniref:Uncharacterized protein n=1 Tax=Vogesella fluminis TaxID=1069161 RepID=A0ABQ3HCB6_9NEIS|nr:hypothetical protein [Vogesella fluminis]GHD81800.1 hypothetical protein GCM10011419_28380 [Vogesella fluminis]